MRDLTVVPDVQSSMAPKPVLPKPERRRPRIRKASFEDYDQIAAVEAAQGLTIKSRDQWLDLWLGNPAYLDHSDWPIGWVIEDENGRVVGSLGNIPSYFCISGKRYVSAAGRGWAVDVKYRAYSVMLLAHQAKQSGADLIVVTTPSATTVALCTRLGWSRVPVGRWDRSSCWVTNYAKAAQVCLGAATPKLISRTLGSLMSIPMSLMDILSRPGSSKTGYQLEWCAGFDDRFDAFWTALQEQNPGVALSVRDAETLRWHFKTLLGQRRTWILTASDGPRLVGYAIMENRDARSFDLTRVLFIDFQVLLKDPGLPAAMVQFALDRCRREGIHVLENAGCWLQRLHPIRPAPYQRVLETWGYLYRISNPELEEALSASGAWYPTQYDGDASL